MGKKQNQKFQNCAKIACPRSISAWQLIRVKRYSTFFREFRAKRARICLYGKFFEGPKNRQV